MATVAPRRNRTVSSTGKHSRTVVSTPWWERVAMFFGVIIFLGLLVALAGILYATYVFYDIKSSLPAMDQLVEYRPGGITRIYATDKDPKTGAPVQLGEIFGQYKEPADIREIPKVVLDATVAIEDERFYEHRGIDLWAIGRALYRNVQTRHMGEGASTVTQQLARNIFLTKKKTINRKLQEMMLALQIEQTFTKQQILMMYLNEVCYGANTFGIKAAAKVYFNKPLNKLTLGEAALLAGIPQRPSAFELFHHLDDAKKRRDVVLNKMVELRGKVADENGVIAEMATPEQIRKAKKEKIKLAPEPDPENANFKSPYFVNHVLRQFREQMRPGLERQYGDRWKDEFKQLLYNGGLEIYTTLNYRMQREAEAALVNGINAARGKGVTDGALVCVEPKTGYIRAMVGGYDYKKDEYNNAAQGRRQPGSTFKAIIYSAAFKTGRYGPDTYVSNERITLGSGRYAWTPRNFDKGSGGSVTVSRAVENSMNIPAVRVTKAIGLNPIFDTAKAMGVDTSGFRRDYSIALGTQAVSPLEMASVYSVFPNRGNHAAPMCIIRVLDSEGNLILNNEPRIRRNAIPEYVATQMDGILRKVVTQGTGRPVKEIPDAHGKTGTTNERRDIWFIGYTPELSTAVWLCGVKKTVKNKKRIIEYKPLVADTFGGMTCGPIWSRFMKAAVPIQRGYPGANRRLPLGLSDPELAAKIGSTPLRQRRTRRRST
ncbi:MAG: PBP1A family penicillin-binding protein, partial [Capsulimonadales bacterium]|nr:PBP1A family penicillin-binding protein [Capsulimonadales bacterium]